ncbi:MAG: hypothetical protein U0670_18940 [Anaerolineae bacterium]
MEENRLRTLIDSADYSVGGTPFWMADSRHLLAFGRDGVFFVDTVTGQFDLSPHWIIGGGDGVITATADRVLTTLQMRYGNITYISRVDGTDQHELPGSLFPTHTGLALAPSW